MKLFELYETTEDNNEVPSGGSLTGLLRGFVGVISQTSGNPNQYTAVQQALSNHTLVTGMAETGHYILGDKAWTGATDGTWTPALAQAINAWKRSVNYQLTEAGERNRLEENATSPSINERDVTYLLAPLNDNGLLMQSGREDRVQRYTGPDTLQPWEGQTYTPRLAGSVEDVDTTTRSMLDAIGWSGWYIICQAIAREKVGEDADNAQWDAETVRCLRAVYSNISHTPDRWYHFFRTIVIGNRQGFTIPVNDQPTPIIYTDNFAPTARDLYLFYAPIAEGLFNEQEDQRETARAEREEALDNTEVMLDNNQIGNIASIFQQALLRQNAADSVLDFFGLDGSSEIEMIAQAMNLLRTAADWNAVSDEFERRTQKDLADEIFREFNRDQYQMYFASRIQALRVVSPRLNFAAINWQQGQEEISVRLNIDETETIFEVQRELASDGSIRIGGYDGPNDYNIFVIDEIIQNAVEVSGGTLPDLNAEVEESYMLQAANLFIVAIEASYPEMTSFYSYGPPFSSTNTPDIGRVRRLAIQTIMARMLQAGAADADAIASAVVEIGNDREWLIGDGTEDNIGAANIYFDERYRDDGIAGRIWTPSRLDDDVELTDDEEAIYTALTSTNADERRDAVQDIFDASDREGLYTRLYRYSMQQQTPLEDLIGDGIDSVRRIIFGDEDTETDGVIARLSNEFGMPVVAPMAMAQLFHDGIGSGWDGTEEEDLQRLIGAIDSREDYELINERYITLSGVESSLWNAIDNETIDFFDGFDSLKAQLAAAIGEEYEETASADLDSTITFSWNSFEREPSVENAQAFDNAIRNTPLNFNQARVMLETITDWLDDYDPESDRAIDRQAWPQAYIILDTDLNEVIEILRGDNPNFDGGLKRFLEDLIE